MAKPHNSKSPLSAVHARPSARRKAVPHSFVLDAVAEVAPTTRAMFGALAVYVGDRIIFLLRDRPDDRGANGVWLAIQSEHQESLRSDFPHAEPVRIMGKYISGWQLLSVDAPDFEQSALRACELVVKGDRRIGKVPGRARTAALQRDDREFS